MSAKTGGACVNTSTDDCDRAKRGWLYALSDIYLFYISTRDAAGILIIIDMILLLSLIQMHRP